MLIGTFGPTGIGKSYLNLRIAELWYAIKFKMRFPIEHITFSGAQLVNLLHKQKNEGTLKKGGLYIFDDAAAGGEMGALEFQSKAAKNLNYVFQSFRSWNLIILINLPYQHMLNKTMRTLLHMRLLPDHIKDDVMYARAHWLKYVQTKAEPLTPRIKALYNGSYHKITFLPYRKPSEWLSVPYEEMKDKFVHNVVGKTADIFNENTSVVEKIPQVEQRKELTEKQEQVMKLLANVNATNKTEKVAEMLGVGISAITKTKKLAEKKGYRLREFKNEQ